MMVDKRLIDRFEEILETAQTAARLDPDKKEAW